MDLSTIEHETLDWRHKGVPLGETVKLSELGSRGWNVADGDLLLPVTTLRVDAVRHNIATLAAYCRRNGVSLAPHGKTTMSPQLFDWQLGAGAWALTAATPGQVQIMRQFGVSRIILANELVEADALRWVGEQLEDDEGFEFICLVDSIETVAMMDAALNGVLTARRLPVLLEVGVAGGRTGVRDLADAVPLAESIAASRTLELIGVETYEGLAGRSGSAEDIAAVDELLSSVRWLVVSLSSAGLFARHEVIVSAGGSVHFDRVVENFANWPTGEVDPRIVLRSGCYLSHDAGRYHRLSPLDGRREAGETLSLRDALESWAVVLSVPEPGLAILGTGKRDVPYDVEMPIPMRVHRKDGSVAELENCVVTGMMDQHAFMSVDPSLSIAPGDIVALGLSHPCGAFDKMPFIPLVDDAWNVVDGLLTFF
jgi:D-serine dehydratase